MLWRRFLSEFKSRDCSFELIIFPNGHHFLCFYLPDTSVALTLSQTSLTSFINNVIKYTSEGGSLDCFQPAFFAIVFFLLFIFSFYKLNSPTTTTTTKTMVLTRGWKDLPNPKLPRARNKDADDSKETMFTYG